MRPEILQELLARAAEEPLGLVIECVNAPRMQIYMCEANKGNDEITVTLPSTPNTIFLVRKSVELDP